MTFEQTGIKQDANKPPLGKIHPWLLMFTAHVMGEGDKDYGEGNWKGLFMSRIVDAMDRHLLAIKSGEDFDPKSKKPHYAHIAAGASFLAHFHEAGVYGTAQDDRPWRGLRGKYPDKPSIPVVDMIRESKSGGEFADDRFPDKPVEPKSQTAPTMQDAIGAIDAITSIDRLTDEIVDWADAAIGKDRTYQMAIQKLAMEELPELLLSPEDPLEWADVAIIVLDLARLAKIDPVSAIRNKLDINRSRTFRVNPRTGLPHHI